MANVKNVQLHELIKNSLATYLSYKWSENKLYLKKRNKKSHNEESDKKHEPKSVDKQHSIINLENDVFIYDAKTKTFTQLDLCDCFKNGFKYRKMDPFGSASSSKKQKKYELCEISNNSGGSAQQFQTYQLMKMGDSVENIFNHGKMNEGNEWGNALKNLCPSKFDLFIQNELNKCAGRSFNVKSFKINSEHESTTSSRNKVCSSAAIGYYTITSYDNGLQCDRLDQPKAIQDKGNSAEKGDMIYEDVPVLKKMYNKGLQCKRSFHSRHRSSRRNEKISSTSETGIQCNFPTLRNAEPTMEPLDPIINKILSKKRRDNLPRPKLHTGRRQIRKRHSSLSAIITPDESMKAENMIDMNSSAEIRKILSESHSTSSLNESYMENFMKRDALFTYYQTSSTSKDDSIYMGRKPIVVATTSAPIPPTCTVGGTTCRERYQKKHAAIPTCKCVKPSQVPGSIRDSVPGSVPGSIPGSARGSGPRQIIGSVPGSVPGTISVPIQAPIGCSITCPNPCNTRTMPTKCPSDCPCSCQEDIENRNSQELCICQPPPQGTCCTCMVDASCICDVLCNLKERIKRQTEEQNRNLDQILEELSKQDKELKEIRRLVELSKRQKNKNKGAGKPCTCYAAEVQYNYTTDMTPLPDKTNKKGDTNGSGDSEKIPDVKIIELFGSDEKPKSKQVKKVSKRDSWKGILNRNNEVKAYFVNDLYQRECKLRERNISSSNSQTDYQLKKRKKWFHISNFKFTSKRDLKKSSA